jgi:DNA-binding response OmpR family regulator
VKPFGSAELLARIDSALRRSRLRERDIALTTIGALTVDFAAHRATREGKPIEITAHELKLLRFLLRHENELLSRQRILDAVWGADYFGTERTVDNFVTRLRAKIEHDPKAARHLVTIRGAGYRFSRRGDGEGGG